MMASVYILPSSWTLSPKPKPKPNTITISSFKSIPPRPKYAGKRSFESRISASSAESSESTAEEEAEAPDMVRLAFSKADAYRKSRISKPITERNPPPESIHVTGMGGGGSDTEVPVSVKMAMDKAREYKKNKRVIVPDQNPVPESTNVTEESGDPGTEVPASIKLAMEKAREYRKNKGIIGAGNIAEKKEESEFLLESQYICDQEENFLLSLEGMHKIKMGNSRDGVLESKAKKVGKPTISSIDFLGLNFSDKSTNKGAPAGLAPLVDNFSGRDLPEVEIIVGDTSKFEGSRPSKATSNEDDFDTGLYKPKVSTWGVFPRPSNISKTFGGGKTIGPGEVLETAEVKAAKEARTRQLITNYKNTMGLSIDANTKSECEKALKEGDYLMDLGKLREALPFYEKVMKELVFQSELHGLAALQWSICQDSLSRPNEARIMYEKLRSHPNVQVSKKAKQFLFGFQAMEMMKITSSAPRTGYENYFEAFVEKKADYTPIEDQNEGSLRQIFPYMIILLSPIFLVLLVAARKGVGF